MQEDQERELIQRTGAEAMVLVYGLCRAVALYDPNNTAIIRILESLERCLEQVLPKSPDGLKLQLLAEEFFVNGRLLKVDASLYERATALAKILSKYDLGEVHFQQGTTRADLDAFTEDLARSVRSPVSVMRPEGYGHIKLAKSSGHSVASFRFDPRKLAVLLYGSLLDLVEGLYAEHAKGHTPSLLPLRRSFQLIIDNMGDHGAIYQVLAAVRDPSSPMDIARLRVATAIDVVGYGIYLDLPRKDIMYLALGGILGGLSNSTDPDEAVEPIYAFPGLGDSAMPLVLVIHDTRSNRLGKPVGVPGRMMAAVELYQELTSATPTRPAQAPAKVLRAMVEGRVPGADRGASRAFMDYKGPYPLGSAVKLSNGVNAIVVSQGAGDQGKLRPVTARFGLGGSLEERIDLSARPQLQIIDTPNPDAIGLNLART